MTRARRPVTAAAIGVVLATCGPSDAPGRTALAATDAVPAGSAPPTDTIEGTWTSEDWAIFDGKVRWAVEGGLDTLSLGESLAALGLSFVGTTYTPRTLEAPGPERLVINLRELDCVTFVENVLAMSWFVRNEGIAGLEDPSEARARFERYLRSLRYRDGRLDGYPSRLHYFSEWLSDNDSRGLLALRTDELGGIPDDEPIDFMSTHPDAYRQLADPAHLDAVRRVETALSGTARLFVPEARVEDVEEEIATGDVIAATSSVSGLDVAHTGIAVRVDGRLHLLHAPLVGSAVQLSEASLADRLRGLEGQDGIMVARPLEWPAGSD